MKVDYNNIWYSFYKASKEDIIQFLSEVLTKRNILFKSLNIKSTFTDWEHSNFNIVFSLEHDLKTLVYNVKDDTVNEYVF